MASARSASTLGETAFAEPLLGEGGGLDTLALTPDERRLFGDVAVRVAAGEDPEAIALSIGAQVAIGAIGAAAFAACAPLGPGAYLCGATASVIAAAAFRALGEAPEVSISARARARWTAALSAYGAEWLALAELVRCGAGGACDLVAWRTVDGRPRQERFAAAFVIPVLSVARYAGPIAYGQARRLGAPSLVSAEAWVNTRGAARLAPGFWQRVAQRAGGEGLVQAGGWMSAAAGRRWALAVGLVIFDAELAAARLLAAGAAARGSGAPEAPAAGGGSSLAALAALAALVGVLS